MIVVSGSLPKSASTWLFNVTDALIHRAGFLDAQAVRDRFGLHGVLRSQFNEISYATPGKLARLLPAVGRGHHVLVKTHEPPSRSLRALLRLGLARGTYIYRDPRDVALSALDHGRRAREQGFAHRLGQLHTVEDAIGHAQDLLRRHWAQWNAAPDILRLRYEETTADPVAALRRIAEHLRLEVEPAAAEEIAARFDSRSLDPQQRERLLINKARPGRFRDEMSAAEQRLASDRLGPFLAQMGYAA